MNLQEAIKETLVLEAIKIGSGNATLKDVDFMDFDGVEDDLKRMGIKASKKKSGPNRNTLVTLTGSKKKLFLYLTSANYGLPDDDAVEMYPQLLK